LSIGLENAAIQNNQPSPLLKAPMSPVTGVVLPYQISLPNLPDWVKMQKMGAYDREYIFGNACMGVIAEPVGTHNSQHTADLAIGLMKKRVPNATTTEPTHIDIGLKFWATFDAAATVQGMDFKYRYYVYGDDNNTYQIITWCNPQSFDHFAPVFDRIAQSFKMP
jgi:hypothetical protein